MIPVALATEDALSEAMVRRLLAEIGVPHRVEHALGQRGFGYLRAGMDKWRAMAQQYLMVVLTDLDTANCPLAFRNEWLGNTAIPTNLVFRIAVKEIEAWALADPAAVRALLGPKGRIPNAPDTLPNPKQALLQLAKNAPKEVRHDLLRNSEGQLKQGVGYNARLAHWVHAQWSPERAAENSPSLARARKHLKHAMRTFKPA